MVINGMGRNSPAAPFGGTNQSGFGREGGRAIWNGADQVVHR